MSEEQELLRHGLRELLDRECDARRVRAIAYDGDGRDAALWRSVADAGWTGIAVPEEFGGAGLRFEDVCIVLEEAGRAALPLPLTTTLLGARMLSRYVDDDPACAGLLRRISASEATITFALAEYPDGDRRDSHLTAVQDGGDWIVNGTHEFVPYGPLADVVVLHTREQRALFLVPTSTLGFIWTDLDVMDRGVRHFDLSVSNVRLPGNARFVWEDEAGIEAFELVEEWTVALAAEALGACERMLEMSIAYAKERVQFGRPIGANQSVKNRLADMGAAIERMRAAVYHAAVKTDGGAVDRGVAVAMAKIATAGQGAWLASQAIHVHGGVGFTWEHDLHLYFKRVKSNELLLGDDSVHLERVAEAVLSHA